MGIAERLMPGELRMWFQRVVPTTTVVVCLISSCSSAEPAKVKGWQQNYCTELGAWQDARRVMAASAQDVAGDDDQSGQSSEFDDFEVSGYAAVAAAKVLDREGLDRNGSHILNDTAAAVDGDTGAESRAVSYCDGSGFETLVG
ncbi:hypothetical protein ACFWVC_09280 [Streptomyces sp. NPDC058691]|uniref:hypothetical protein n=1 Tax=Streptomyces sp. NPDC058691 TaxID=3346601 RepID=UPI0036525BC6